MGMLGGKETLGEEWLSVPFQLRYGAIHAVVTQMVGATLIAATIWIQGRQTPNAADKRRVLTVSSVHTNHDQ